MSSDALTGRTALVTGSGRNIGRAIAIAFARHGANVVVNGHRDRDAVDAVVDEITGEGGRAIGVIADVSNADEVGRMVAEATDAFGGVDIAVSNVGRRARLSFEAITVEEWNAIIATNLSGAFYIAHHTVPAMRERGWGRIIHISGQDGFAGHIPERAANITAKAGLHGLSKAIAREYGAHGITANTVAPGPIDTVRDPSQYAHIDPDEVVSRMAIKRYGHCDDVAEACLYLAGESGRFVTGQAIHVNGGEFMF
jgi:NAD(P)-dependent dehydrogenase (short-subunit alcohol dehydrogenase family)